MREARSRRDPLQRAARARAEAEVRAEHEAIRAIAQVRGCPRAGEAWVANNMGTAQQFLKAIGAQAARLEDLFNGGPIRQTKA